MASGYKAFVAATVLDAADLTDFCSSQSVMRFANAAARDAALTVSIVKEGMVAYLQDTNVIQVNTDSTLAGWKQIYPVITAGITDAQITNAKMAADSVSSANIIAATIIGGDIAAGTITSSNITDGTITGTDIAAGTITGSNIQDGSIGTAELAAGTYAISISGNAATASSASTATSALDSNTLGGYAEAYQELNDTIVLRGPSSADVLAGRFRTNDTTLRQFYNDGTHTQIGDDTARVVNATTIYSQAVSGRTVLVSSAGTLGTSSSSRRFKENITNLPYEAADILKLNPIIFQYREDHLEEGADRPIEVGLIAEELADLGFEELIFRGTDGQPNAIAYEKIAVALLKVCQTQQTQLDALSARLDTIGA